MFVATLVDHLGSMDAPLAKQLALSASEVDRAEGWETVAIQTFQHSLTLLGTLYEMSAMGRIPANALICNPFDKSSPAEISRKYLSKLPDAQRTKTLSPEDFMSLMNAAAEFCFTYGPYIVDCGKKLRSQKGGGHNTTRKANQKALEALFDAERPPGAPFLMALWKKNGKGSADVKTTDRVPMLVAYKALAGASAILLAGLSGRRKFEIENLLRDCVRHYPNGLYGLRSYIAKTVQDIDEIPIPPMVASIVEQLDQIALPGSEFLFEISASQSNDVLISHKLDIWIESFFEISGATVHGISETFAAHQLRRGFAIFYFFGFDHRDLNSLAWFFKHFDPEMTRIYVTEIVAGEITQLRDEIEARKELQRQAYSKELDTWITEANTKLQGLFELGEIFDEVRCEAYVYRLLSLYKGEDSVIGKGAARLYRTLDGLVEQASADIRISGSANDPAIFEGALIKRIYAEVATRSLMPTPGNVNHCLAEPGNETDLQNAECLKLEKKIVGMWSDPSEAAARDRVNFAFSSAYTCLKCSNCVAFKENQRKHAAKLQKLEQNIATAATASIKASTESFYEEYRDEFLGELEAATAFGNQR